MFNFFRKKKNYPAFPALAAWPHKHYYFVRVAGWDWLDKEHIFVTDPHQARVLTLDPWPQLVFLEANGQLTISETIYSLAGQYTSAIPEELDATVIAEIEKLIIYGIIEYSETKKWPLPAFNLPKSKQAKG